ncbi:hypothetical protein GOODEAATRI_005047 [Goodea atripinnis]|uniref:Uncharacterized protein n=1 Tax=Goodea atripinnis TaxID=208336 RepID=A0ABV0PKY1_9TELE
MPPGVVTAPRSSSAGCFFACRGAKIRPYFSENSVICRGEIYQPMLHLLTCTDPPPTCVFLHLKGSQAGKDSISLIRVISRMLTGDIQQHLQTMFTLLRPEDNIKLATRYMVVVSTIGRQDTEESLVLGMDFSPVDRVQYILNVTREIDNFFPGVFEYHNIRVYDEEATDLLAYWNETYKFISRAKKSGSKCLVHCKMGISRSAATVIAYSMKEYGWDLKNAFDYVKERRTVTKPNPSFMRQLEEYQGILLARYTRTHHHEPLSKSLAQPNSLGRSDHHNQASSMPGPSVRDLLESLGTSPSTGKAAYSTSQPDTGIQSSLLGSSAFDDTASLSGDAKTQSLEGPSQADKAFSRQPTPHHHDSTAGSVLSSTLSNGLCDSEEQPSLSPLSQPRAATVVPEPERTDVVTVAQSVLVGQPHPPPSVHHLPPSPAPSSTNEAVNPQVSSFTQLVSVPEPIASSTQQPGSNILSAPVLIIKTDNHQTCSSDPPTSIDNISHPNAVPQDNVLLFGHSADHINFFSAREKFKGMSHDGKTQNAAVQQSTLLKSCGKDHVPLAQEGGNSEGQEEENRKVAGVKPTDTLTQAEPQSSHNHEGTRSKQEMENLDTVPQEEAKSEREESKHKGDEESAPAHLYMDWTRGSVRRVTQQLEQRMKQEHETPLTSSSALSLTGSTSCSQRRPNSIQSITVSVPQDAAVCPQVSVVSTLDEERLGGDGMFRPVGRGDALGVLGNINKSTKGHKLQPADTRLLSTSSSLYHSVQSPFASINFLCLEGVTELESCVDRDCFIEGPHADITMRETWETLCELGAFLQHVGSGGACKALCMNQGLGSTPNQGCSLQKRVREVETRIRQAGLTPPSLIKRSASLAKLGCLELLANDLNELERSCSVAAPPSTQAPLHTGSDESKKQRVHSSPTSSHKQPEALNITAMNLSAAGESLPPSNQSPLEEKLPNADQDSLHSPGQALLTNRQQYGKTHPLRQLQKRTVSTLYHTM